MCSHCTARTTSLHQSTTAAFIKNWQWVGFDAIYKIINKIIGNNHQKLNPTVHHSLLIPLQRFKKLSGVKTIQQPYSNAMTTILTIKISQ